MSDFSTLSRLCFIALLAVSTTAATPRFKSAPQTFRQEIAETRSGTAGFSPSPVQFLDQDANGLVRAFAQGHWQVLRQERWIPDPSFDPKVPTEMTFPGPSGSPVTASVPWKSIQHLVRSERDVWLISSNSLYQINNGQTRPSTWPSQRAVHQFALGPKGEIIAASEDGLFQLNQSRWDPVEAIDSGGRSWASRAVLGTGFDTKGQLWIATRAGVGCRTDSGWRFFEGHDGLPWNDFTGLTAGPVGTVWFATHLGAIYWDGSDFHYRQGPGWLPNDDVRQILSDSAGDTWFSTAGGLSRIRRVPMTLARKAEFYELEIEQYIKRTTYGFTAEAPLRKAGDKSTANPNDSDNDGLWTAMYGAGECFAYGATQDKHARDRAIQAFEALRFLQKVTQGGKPSPPHGFVARTVRPIDWPDPNIGRLQSDQNESKHDALWKIYQPRWPKSADGQWYWKSDTSSDELDGHFFFYAAYFDLVAKSPEEKARVREVVADLANHLLDHQFNLVDIDGKPTRWGAYGPDSVNGDARWWPERGLNSLSILSYLSVAAHITGNDKYAKAASDLVKHHGYAQNLMFPKVHFGPGSGNQSDDEMAVMCYYTLLKYNRDPAIRDRVLYSFFSYWALEAPELNPFFHFAFAAHGLDQSIQNVWGTFPVSPWNGWHEDSLNTLRGFPLDRVDWSHRNSHRLDLVLLPPQKSKDLYEPKTSGRGHRVNGRVLPVENRHFEHWNTDPWDLDYGGNGGTLGSGTVFLLPYYLGLYHGFIDKP